MKTKPSEFLDFPDDSVEQSVEAEIVARNIMVILSKTGDKFRRLSFDEYKAWRKKDGNFTMKEKPFFDAVVKYATSRGTAVLFSDKWSD